jgi:sugar transferase (PEP-CTERM system associated)
VRVGEHSIEGRKLGLFIAEQAMLFSAFVIAASGAARLFGPSLPRDALYVEGAFATMTLQLGLYLADLYDFKVAWEDAREHKRLLKVLGAATIVCGLGTLLLPATLVSRLAAIAGLGGACTVALLLRAALPDVGWQFALRPRVLVAGQGRAAAALLSEIHKDGHAELAAYSMLGGVRSDLLARARATDSHTLVVAADDRRGLDVRELLACRLAGLEVIQAITFCERVLKKIPIELVKPSDLVFSDGFQRPRLLLWMRRAVSLATSVVLFIFALPILLLAAIAIKLDSPGPVFYSQERVGAHGQTFWMLKFRTMRTDAESGTAKWALKNDPRVTRVGKWLRRFRIDELPQIFNVIRGEMNVVGPRPERPEFVERLSEQIPYYDLRALVPPGITGWAQIRYPYAASLEEAREKLQYDLYYVKHLSVMLDLVILFHTAKTVLFGRGAR